MVQTPYNGVVNTMKKLRIGVAIAWGVTFASGNFALCELAQGLISPPTWLIVLSINTWALYLIAVALWLRRNG